MRSAGIDFNRSSFELDVHSHVFTASSISRQFYVHIQLHLAVAQFVTIDR